MELTKTLRVSQENNLYNYIVGSHNDCR